MGLLIYKGDEWIDGGAYVSTGKVWQQGREIWRHNGTTWVRVWQLPTPPPPAPMVGVTLNNDQKKVTVTVTMNADDYAAQIKRVVVKIGINKVPNADVNVNDGTYYSVADGGGVHKWSEWWVGSQPNIIGSNSVKTDGKVFPPAGVTAIPASAKVDVAVWCQDQFNQWSPPGRTSLTMPAPAPTYTQKEVDAAVAAAQLAAQLAAQKAAAQEAATRAAQIAAEKKAAELAAQLAAAEKAKAAQAAAAAKAAAAKKKVTKTYTDEWKMSWFRSYNGSNTNYSWGTDNNRAMHGQYLKSNGRTKSLIGFPNVTSQLGEIQEVAFYVYMDHWNYYSGGTLMVGVHGHGSAPAKWSATNVGLMTAKYTQRDQGRWIYLPSNQFKNFKEGKIRGISLAPNSNATSYYGYAKANVTKMWVKHVK